MNTLFNYLLSKTRRTSEFVSAPEIVAPSVVVGVLERLRRLLVACLGVSDSSVGASISIQLCEGVFKAAVYHIIDGKTRFDVAKWIAGCESLEEEIGAVSIRGARLTHNSDSSTPSVNVDLRLCVRPKLPSKGESRKRSRDDTGAASEDSDEIGSRDQFDELLQETMQNEALLYKVSAFLVNLPASERDTLMEAEVFTRITIACAAIATIELNADVDTHKREKGAPKMPSNATLQWERTADPQISVKARLTRVRDIVIDHHAWKLESMSTEVARSRRWGSGNMPSLIVDFSSTAIHSVVMIPKRTPQLLSVPRRPVQQQQPMRDEAEMVASKPRPDLY